MEEKAENPKKKEVLMHWTSPSRMYKKRTKEFYANVAAIIFLFTVILVIASEFMLVLAVLSIVFFIYVTSSVPPEEVEHRITNLGLDSAGRFYHWEELVDFWFEEQWGQVKMVLRPRIGLQIVVLMGQQEREKVRDLVAKYIPFREEPQKNWVDNAASWLSEKIPLEKPAS